MLSYVYVGIGRTTKIVSGNVSSVPTCQSLSSKVRVTMMKREASTEGSGCFSRVWAAAAVAAVVVVVGRQLKHTSFLARWCLKTQTRVIGFIDLLSGSSLFCICTFLPYSNEYSLTSISLLLSLFSFS